MQERPDPGEVLVSSGLPELRSCSSCATERCDRRNETPR